MLRITISVLLMILLLVPLWTQEPKNEPTPIKERIIYVPYHQLENLVPVSDTGVYLSYQEYKALLDELERLKQKPSDLPVSAVLSDIHYQGTVKENFIEVVAIGNLNVLKEGWHSLSLDFGNIAIKEATLDKEAAFLKWKAQGYELLFQSQKAEKKQFQITFMVPIQKDQQFNAVVQFNVPRSPIAELNLEIPATAGQDPARIKAQVEPSLAVQTTPGTSTLQLHALLGNTDQVKITWQSQIERKIEIKNILHAENLTQLEVGENFLQLITRVRYDLIQGDVSTLAFKLPESFRVLKIDAIQGGTVQSWDQPENSNDLQITLNNKIINQGDERSDFELEITAEKVFKNKVMETKFSLPSIEILGIEREKGFYTIIVNDVHKLNVVERKDITPIDIPDLPDYVKRQGIEKAFKYLKRPYSIAVELEKKEPEYNVVTYVYANLTEADYMLYANISYDITQSRIFGTKIEIPTGFKLESAVGHDLAAKDLPPSKAYPSRPSSTQDLIKEYRELEDQGKKFLNIVFNKGIRSSNLVIKLSMKKSFVFAEKECIVALPVFQVQGAKSEIGNIGISAKSSFSITTIDKSMKNVQPLDVKQLFTKKAGISPYDGKMPINIGLEYSLHPIAAEFKVEKLDPSITAIVYNYVDVAENLLTHRFNIIYKVEYTGVKEFSFTLPKEIADQVPTNRITEPQANNLIKEIKTANDEATNMTTYTVQMQREVLGLYELQVVYEKKLEPSEKEQTHAIFELKTLKTKQENGFIVFKKNNNLALDFFGQDKDSPIQGMEVSDISDQTYKGDKKDVLAIYKYSKPGYKLTLWMKKMAFEPVLNTVIRELHISSTINKDFTCKNEALLVIMNNRNQMLEFCVPEGCKITAIYRAKTSLPASRPRAEEISQYFDPLYWSVYDNPVDPLEGWQYFKVNIAANAQKNAPFVLLINYESTLTTMAQAKKMAMRGDMKITSIRFVSVPIIYFTWELGLPSEYQYTWFESNLGYDLRQTCRGFWSFATKALHNFSSVESTPIDQDAATGLIPSYPVSGTRFNFHRMNGDGYVNIYYIYRYWYNSLHAMTCLLIFIIIFGLAKIRCSVLPWVFLFSGVAAVLASLNLQGYQNLWCTVFAASITAGTLVWFHRLFSGWGDHPSTSVRKTHQLYRDKQLQNEETLVSADANVINPIPTTPSTPPSNPPEEPQKK